MSKDQKEQVPSVQMSIVDQLVSDPAAPPDLAMFIGYPGRSPREGHHRLYLSADLRDFLDIPHQAVHLAHPIPQALDPLGAVYLWVQPEAPLVRGRQGAAGLARYFALALEQGGLPPPPMPQPMPQPQWGPPAACNTGACWQPGQYQTQAPYMCGPGGWR